MDQSRSHEIEELLRDAKASLRMRERFSALALLLPVGIALAGLLVGVSRFTLADIPGWTPIIPVVAVIAAAFAWGAMREISHSQAAAFLDRVWGLDERLSTFTQMQRRQAFTVLKPGDDVPLKLVADDAWYAARKANRDLPAVPRFAIARSTLAGIALGVGMLLFALFAASPADRVRAEIASAQEALIAQLEQIAGLRTEIERLGIPENLKASMLSELDNLEKALRAAGPDKNALRAALGDAQSRIGALTPERINQWGEIIRASQALQDMARRSVSWQPPAVDDLSELTSGALAAEAIGASIDKVSVGLQAEMAQELDSLSRLVLAKSRTLSTAFEEGSVSLYGRNMGRAGLAFEAMAEELRRLEKRELSAQAVEQALAKLEDGKQELLKDHNTEKRAQVGFNRGDRDRATAEEQTGGGGTSEPNAGTQGQEAKPTDDSTGKDGGRSGVPGARAGSGETEGGSGTSPNTTGGAVEGDGPLQPVGENAQPGAANGEATQGENGTLDAPVAGNPGSVSGGITKVENPQGVGSGESGQAAPTSGPGDRVYVPQVVPGAQGGQGGQAGQGDGGPAPILPDSAGGSANEEEGNAIGGKLTEVRTPYQEVLRDYAQRATEALENTFIPADARKLVRDYFSALGE